MERIVTFLDMGGYAAFVWPSFGTVAVVLIVLLLVSRRALKSSERQLQTIQAAPVYRRRQPETRS